MSNVSYWLCVAVAVMGAFIAGCTGGRPAGSRGAVQPGTSDARGSTPAPPRPGQREILIAKHDEIRGRTATIFDRAMFGKPAEGGDGLLPAASEAPEGHDPWPNLATLGPLFAVELNGDGPDELPLAGALPDAGAAAVRIADESRRRGEDGAEAQAVVFWERSVARVGGKRLPQVAYYWQFREDSVAAGRLDGLRITLGADGWPLVLEVFAADDGVVRVYVTDRLEREALRLFGGPLPGREHAVERAVEERPDVVVARVIRGGPMPMGPWAYISRDGAVTTLLCRCSPSQVAGDAAGAYYELRAVERFAAPERPDWRDERWLERALRWPE